MTDEYGQLRLINTDAGPITLSNQAIIDYIWEWENNFWTPQIKTIPLSTSWLRLLDNSSNLWVDLSLIICNNYPLPNTPLLAISQGVVIKKDLSVGGFVASNQGVLALGSGLKNSFDPPGIWLQHSDKSPLESIEWRSSPPTSDLKIGQCFKNTNNSHLYQYNGSGWVDKGLTSLYEYDFDTCYIRKAGYHVDLPFSTPGVPIVDYELGNLRCYDTTSVTTKVKSAAFFYGVQDQLRFIPVGYDGTIWTYKPAENKLFAIWNQGTGSWKFHVDTSGNIQCYCNIFPASANNGNIGTDTNYWGSIWANYVCGKNWWSFGCDRSLSDTPIERKFTDINLAETFLRHEATKEWRHMPYGKQEDTIICVCGKEQKEPCPEHLDEWNDRYLIKTGDMIEASANLTLKLLEEVKSLRSEIAQLKN